MQGHQINEERSLLLHRAVVDKLRDRPELVAKARDRVESWLAEGTVHPRYGEAWLQLLSSSLEEISAQMIDPSESMRALRQCSPFAGVLTAQERWRVLREAPSP